MATDTTNRQELEQRLEMARMLAARPMSGDILERLRGLIRELEETLKGDLGSSDS